MAATAKKSDTSKRKAATKVASKVRPIRALSENQIETELVKLQTLFESLGEDLEDASGEEDAEQLSELLYNLAADAETLMDECGALSERIRKGLGLEPLAVDDSDD